MRSRELILSMAALPLALLGAPCIEDGVDPPRYLVITPSFTKDGMEVATLQPCMAEAATLCIQVRCIKDGMEVATLTAGMFVGEHSLL